MEYAKKIIELVTPVGGIIAAFWALFVYRSNSRRERARWAESLYERFYEKKELKEVRDKLDCEAPNAVVDALIGGESSELTDYLNFFEFMAYLQSSKQLSRSDIEGLFSYYLECMKRHDKVEAYIKNPKNGFEYLRKLLFHE